MARLAHYDPSLVIVTVGLIPITGFADGTFLTIERDEDTFSVVVGASGEAARSKNANRMGSVTLTLLQTSLANALLSDLALADETLPGGAGCVPLLIKDLSGSALFGAEFAWVQKPARAEYGKEAGPREWMIRAHDLQVFVGGN